MTILSFITRAVVVATVALIPWSGVAAPTNTAMEAPAPHSAIQGLGRIAVGSVEDTLQACLGRIPTDATAGQRLLAEHTCQDYEAHRAIVQEAPKF